MTRPLTALTRRGSTPFTSVFVSSLRGDSKPPCQPVRPAVRHAKAMGGIPICTIPSRRSGGQTSTRGVAPPSNFTVLCRCIYARRDIRCAGTRQTGRSGATARAHTRRLQTVAPPRAEFLGFGQAFPDTCMAARASHGYTPRLNGLVVQLEQRTVDAMRREWISSHV